MRSNPRVRIVIPAIREPESRFGRCKVTRLDQERNTFRATGASIIVRGRIEVKPRGVADLAGVVGDWPPC
jgi:hypothetical protein